MRYFIMHLLISSSLFLVRLEALVSGRVRGRIFSTTGLLNRCNRNLCALSASKDLEDDPSPAQDAENLEYLQGQLRILEQTDNYLVVEKPPSVVCHHSGYTGSRKNNEVPMLQRIRQALRQEMSNEKNNDVDFDATEMDDEDTRVNLIHRLDRGCSGCLLVGRPQVAEHDVTTRLLNQAMQAPSTSKTYIALVRGEGIVKERNFMEEGWFTVDRPITNERGKKNDAVTHFRFIAGQDNGGGTIDRPRASLVLCRPVTGRWHQIRKHLNGLSHPILGDAVHGDRYVNREWKERYGMLAERTCLHLARIDMEPLVTSEPPHATIVPGSGLHVSCPLAPDMRYMLQTYLPDVWEAALPLLAQEGVFLEEDEDGTNTQGKRVLDFTVPRPRDDQVTSSTE